MNTNAAIMTPAHYSLVGGPNATVKGKEKVMEMARRFRGGVSAFACPWRSENSRRNILSSSALMSSVSLQAGVTIGESSNSKQAAGMEDETDKLNYEREMAECNQRLSEHLLSIF